MSQQLWRAVAAFRLATLCYAAALIIGNHASYARPNVGLGLLAVMAGWSVLATVGYAGSVRRVHWLVVADVAVAATLIVATRWVDTIPRIEHGVATLPAAWAATAVLACAVAGGPWAGLAGGATLSAADLVERHSIPHATFNGIVLLLIAGTVGGYVVRLALRTEVAVGRTARLAAATAERARIARGVHDSVLQVLALVSVRGREIGGEAARLGELAAQQEVALRALVASQPPRLYAGPQDAQLADPGFGDLGLGDLGLDDAGLGDAGHVDLRVLLEPYATESVTLSGPADPVPLAAPVARAVVAATAECLHNVRGHAGDGARAWVLVEDDGEAIVVTVRDDGVGFGPQRLRQAAAAGRLGVAESIVGRLREVGGTAELTSRPGQGTEVELRVPHD